ncbi:MAG: RsmB/NOP family class I SAM-dependent RNA methyltransferase [Thiobacillaceae bacterium]|nr:RsmB/NOP family class I SAM-dependent RNA methyltransferase [Thiobacillaceae bacterium]
MTPQQLDGAIAALARVLPLDRPADGVLSAYFREHPKLGGRDRAFTAEAVYGVLRHLASLAHLAGGRDPRRLVLAWLARHGGHNLREFEALTSVEEMDWLRGVKSADLAALAPAVRLELPDWLYERLAARHGERLPELAAALNRPAPLDLRVNPLVTDRDAVLAELRAAGLAAEPTPYSPLGIRLRDKPALQRLPCFQEGRLEVQDEGSQLLGFLLAPRRGEMVCDFCAGAGGKTLLLGALMRSTGRLYAFDVAEKRLANLKPRLKRSGLSNVQPQLIAHEHDAKVKRLAGKFDRVLVDAPCSGTGTLRRNPDLKWRQTPAAVDELSAKQAVILAAAARLVKPGGRLLYATCSLLAEENEAIVEDIRQAHPGFRLIPAGEVLAAQHIPLDMADYLRLDPARHGTDGFFAALLEKVS